MAENHETGEAETGRHIVDQLIAERAPRLTRNPLWPLLRPGLYALLGYDDARAMADEIARMGGYEALDHVSDRLDLDLRCTALNAVPAEGACLIVCNHPTGVADGVALYDALKARRPDLCFFANYDALRVCPGLEEAVTPVVWPPEARTLESSKETLRQAKQALGEKRAIVIFPSGVVARMRKGRLRDEPWEATPVTLSRKHGVPIVPAALSGPYSRLFNWFDRISSELRDVTVFHELLNKAGQCYSVRFAEPVDPEEFEDADDETI